jgi:alanyl-tRNA synthetase
LKDFDVDGQRVLIFDKTPFYAEMGGQKWDFGKVILDSGEEVEIKDVQTFAGVSLHLVK